MLLEIDREGIEKHLGEQVEVLEGAERTLGLGVIAYEHNTGRLSVYSPDGKSLRAFLKGDEVIRFVDKPEDTYRVSKGINNSARSD